MLPHQSSLGSKSFEGKYQPIELSEPNVYLKMYGKEISKPMRKLGHFNLLANNNETTDQLLAKIENLKEKVITKPIQQI